MSNKKIFIEYLTIDKEIYEDNVVRISNKPPAYDNYKSLYLYELFCFDFLEDKIRAQLDRSVNYSNPNNFFDSFLITLTEEQFEDCACLFEDKSQYEQDEFDREIYLFKLKIDILRNEPKMWSVD